MTEPLQTICHAGTSCGTRLEEDPSGHRERRQPINMDSADPAIVKRIMFPNQIISQVTLVP